MVGDKSPFHSLTGSERKCLLTPTEHQIHVSQGNLDRPTARAYAKGEVSSQAVQWTAEMVVHPAYA
jgi:hypothetical protein